MKKLLLSILIILTANICMGQIATGVNNLQAFPWRTFSNPNMVGLVFDGSQYRMYGFDKYSLLDTNNATGKFATKYDVSLRLSPSRTISINGITYDLSSDRSWTVGDISSSGSYGNPSWLTSLPWSKITGSPTIYSFSGTASQYTKGDGTYATFPTNVSTFTNDAGYVTSTSLGTTLSGYATATALTNGLSTKQNTLSLTTAGTGAASLVGSTLNIPTPVINTYTAGTGIGIASNVITNTAPDQTVSISSGTGMSITGTYPSFTATNTAPYIAPVITTPTMVIGTSYQAPANKNLWVNASIQHTIALTLVLTSGSSNVQLQTSPNNSTWTTINSCGFSDAVAVAVALNKTVTNNVSGEVPPNYYYRLVATTSGAGSASIVNQQLKTY